MLFSLRFLCAFHSVFCKQGLPHSFTLALTFGSKREAFILIEKQDYKLAAGLREPRIFPLKIPARIAGAKVGCQHRGHKQGGVPGATPLGAERVAHLRCERLTSCDRRTAKGLDQIPDGEENPKQALGSRAGCSQFSSLNMFPALVPLPDLSSSLEHVQPQTHR